MPELYPYQVLAVDWLARQRSAILAFDMGLGKTAIAIGASDRIGARRILVICPAVAITNWEREFKVWQTCERTIKGIRSSKDTLDADVVIINYDKLSRANYLTANIARARWAVVIIDEQHYLKTPDSARTRKIYGRLHAAEPDGVVSRADHVWGLTATPIPNHVGELWTHIRALRPDLLPRGPRGLPLNHHQFIARYCETRDTPFGIQILGNKKAMLPELKAKLKGWVLRLKKAEVLPDLPPIRFVTTTIDAGDLDAELRQLENHPEIQALTDTLKAAQADTALKAGELSRDERQDLLETFANRPGHIATLRRMTSLVKVGPAIKLLTDELETGALTKVVIFAVHRETVELLAEGLDPFGAVKLYGGTSAKDRQAAIDGFQNDPEIRVFVGQVTSAGTAITLTAASDVVFVEASWVPSDNAQAASRAHRIGTKSAVLVRFLALAGSVDELVQNALARKTAAINQVLN